MKTNFVEFAMVTLCGTFVACNAYAFKPRLYLFPEQVACADRIIVGNGSLLSSKIHISVREYLKGAGANELDVQYDCVRQRDRPVLKDQERVVLFLCERNEGGVKLLGYGDQAIWPKTHAKWPFVNPHICNEQDIIVATTNILNVESEPITENKIIRLRQMLASDKLFVRTVAVEYIDLQVNKGWMVQMEQDVRALLSRECDEYLILLGTSVVDKIKRLKSTDNKNSIKNSGVRVNSSARE